MFINVLTQVTILLILIMIGFVLTKSKILTANGAKCMTDIVLYIVTPCVIIKSFVREFDKSLLKGLIYSFVIAVASHIVFIIISRLMFRKSIESQKTVLQFGMIFSNCGFMALPLQEALLGEIGVFYCATYIAVFNLFNWSYGIWLMSGNIKYLSPKKLFLSPGIIGLVVGLIVFIFAIPIPEIIFKPIEFLSDLNTPVPMIIIGFHLANSNFFAGFKNLNLILGIITKLITFPIIALFLMYLCGIRGELLISTIICCCAPSAAMTTMFAAKFERDTSLSVNFVSVSTILSLITMPLIITLAEYLA